MVSLKLSALHFAIFLAQVSSTVALQARSSPTLYPGNIQYQLLGCYNELADPTSDRALGHSGSYISPPFTSPNDVTAPLCLEGCGNASVPVKGGPFMYVAVENALDCFCGLSLSDQSKVVSSDKCSSPCTNDQSTSCGGPGYLALYQLRSALDTSSSSSTTTTSDGSTSSSSIESSTTSSSSSSRSSTSSSSTTVKSSSTTSIPAATLSTTSPTSASKPTNHHKSPTLIYILISLGLFCLACVLLALLIWEARRYRNRHLAQQVTSASSLPPSSGLPGYSPTVPDMGVIEPVYIPPSFRGKRSVRKSWRRSLLGARGIEIGNGAAGGGGNGSVDRRSVVGQRGSWRKSWYGWRDHGVQLTQGEGDGNGNGEGSVGRYRLQQRLSKLDTREGKRFGVVEGDEDSDQVGLWSGHEQQVQGEQMEGQVSEEELGQEDDKKKTRERRNTFEAWKMGLVPGSPVSWGRGGM